MQSPMSRAKTQGDTLTISVKNQLSEKKGVTEGEPAEVEKISCPSLVSRLFVKRNSKRQTGKGNLGKAIAGLWDSKDCFVLEEILIL